MFVSYSDSDPDSTILGPQHHQLVVDFETYLERQSDLPWDVGIITNPDDGDTLRMWQATNTMAQYSDYSWCFENGSYAAYWNTWADEGAAYRHYGELEIETMFRIKDAYVSHQLDNPFMEVDYLIFVLLSQIKDMDAGAEFPYVDAVARLYFPATIDTVDSYFEVIHYDEENSDRVVGVTAGERRNLFKWRWTGVMLAHELGHLLFFKDSHTLDSEAREQVEVTDRTYFYANYDIMTSDVPFDQGFIPYSLWDRMWIGWVPEPHVVTENLRDVFIRDLSIGGNRPFEIPLAPAYKVDHVGDTTYVSQSLLLGYYAGYDEYGESDVDGLPMYRSQGLQVWHRVDNIYDMKTACGRYEDRSSAACDPNAEWDDVDAEEGFDNIHSWPGRLLGDHQQYNGDVGDFFGLQSGATELSYRTNPSAFGASLLANYSTGETYSYRRAPRDLVNSIVVDIKEDHGDYLVADILFAPYEDVGFPNGGEVFEVGEVVTVSWADGVSGIEKHAVIDTVDVYLIKRDVPSNPIPIAEGIPNVYSVEWTVGEEHVSDEAYIRVVYHNSLSSHTCEDESDQHFIVKPVPDVAYVEMSSSTNMTHAGTPYSSVPLDYDGNGYTDLFVSMQDGDGVLYGCDQIQTSTGVPYMSDRTLIAFGSGTLQTSQRGVTAADIDNDGDDDLLVAHATNPDLYVNAYDAGSGQWEYTSIPDSSGVSTLAVDSWSASWCDFDRDDDLDLYVTKAQTSPSSEQPDSGNLVPLPDVLLRNDLDETGKFADVTSSASGMGSAQTGSLSAVWADVDEDGDQDLLVTSLEDPRSSETARLYVNQDDGTFDEDFLGVFGTPSLWYVSGTAWADVNNDGHLDVVFSIQAPTAQSQRLFLGDGGTFAELPLNLSMTSTGVQALDYDLDSRRDLLFLPADAADTPRLMRNISDAATVKFIDVTDAVGLGSIGRVDGAAVSSFVSGRDSLLASDGDLDVFFGRPGSDELFFRASRADSSNSPPANYYVAVNLKPNGAANASSIGAKVTASYTHDGVPITQAQVLDGGSSRGGQGEHILTFGLGDYIGNVDLSIRWPSGNDQLVTVPSTEITGGQIRPPFAVADSTYVTVDPGTFSFSYSLLPSELLEWTFTWDTTTSSKWDLDTVEMEVPGVAPKLASPSLGNATTVVAPLTGGGYRHVLTMTTECVLGIFRFKVRSSTDVKVGGWSGESAKNNKFCPSGGGGTFPGS